MKTITKHYTELDWRHVLFELEVLWRNEAQGYGDITCKEIINELAEWLANHEIVIRIYYKSGNGMIVMPESTYMYADDLLPAIKKGLSRVCP